MKTKKEILVRIQEVARAGDFDPSDPMFKYTGAYPTNGRSTRGYTHDFYVGFFHALEWVLENLQSSTGSTIK